jgi:uncharacterized membrane protein SpoIIM required for sporulation
MFLKIHVELMKTACSNIYLTSQRINFLALNFLLELVSIYSIKFLSTTFTLYYSSIVPKSQISLYASNSSGLKIYGILFTWCKELWVA